jgi:exonuclease VII small subunit
MPIPHTPGPWNAAQNANDSQGLIIAENGANVAVSYDEKDATLIAASPDLLADLEDGTVAAQAVIDSWESGDLADAVNDLQAWLEQAQQTLDKLYGGKQP